VTLHVTSGTAEYEICEVCLWRHDHVDEAEPDRPPLGPNSVSLTLARQNCTAFGASDPKYVGNVRPPSPDETPR
jgi:hypothetical protein